jgi:hypothetical protein
MAVEKVADVQNRIVAISKEIGFWCWGFQPLEESVKVIHDIWEVRHWTSLIIPQREKNGILQYRTNKG